MIGLTGVGKSTIARMLEERGIASRVARVTTRRPRSNDPADLVTTVDSIQASAGDLVIPGWGSDQYCIPAANIAAIRKIGRFPVVELGSFQSANALKMLQAPGYIVLVEHTGGEEHLRQLCQRRGMTNADIEARIESLFEDREELVRNKASVDYVLLNDGTLDSLFEKVKTLAESVCTAR